MKELLIKKFDIPELKQKLIATEKFKIIELNDWVMFFGELMLEIIMVRTI